MQYHQPRQHHPGDAPPADPAQMALPIIEVRKAWQIVAIRIMGDWRLGLLTEWRRPPDGQWVAHVRWGPDAEPGLQWAWVRYEPATLRPLSASDVKLPDT